MATEAVTDAVRRMFAEALKIHVPSDDTDLIDGGLLDSLALVELLFQIEREFGVEVSLDDFEIESFRSVALIADFVERANRANAA